MKKLLSNAFFGIVMAAGIFAFSAVPVSADCIISTTLRLGSMGPEVQCLQSHLGVTQSGVFDLATRNAVVAFQARYGLVADGIFGPISRATWMASFPVVVGNFPPGCTSNFGFSATTGLSCSGVTNLPAGCQPGYLFSATTGVSCSTGTPLPPGCASTSGFSPVTGIKCDSLMDDDNDDDDDEDSEDGDDNDDNDDDDEDDDDDDLSGGEGSASYELASSPSNEEVGEGEDNVEVAGLEIEAEGSDIELTSVQLIFNEGTATNDFEDYADEVSIWLDGELVGQADGDEFNEDNEWSATISLDDAIIREGDTGELVVAVSAVSSFDAGNDGDSWSVDFRQIRFEDAEGDITSEDPATSTRTFSFES